MATGLMMALSNKKPLTHRARGQGQLRTLTPFREVVKSVVGRSTWLPAGQKHITLPVGHSCGTAPDSHRLLRLLWLRGRQASPPDIFDLIIGEASRRTQEAVSIAEVRRGEPAETIAHHQIVGFMRVGDGTSPLPVENMSFLTYAEHI
jgi:hypothetical protein